MNALLLESSGKLLRRSILAANIRDRVMRQQFASGSRAFDDAIDQAAPPFEDAGGAEKRLIAHYFVCQSVCEKSLP